MYFVCILSDRDSGSRFSFVCRAASGLYNRIAHCRFWCVGSNSCISSEPEFFCFENFSMNCLL